MTLAKRSSIVSFFACVLLAAVMVGGSGSLCPAAYATETASSSVATTSGFPDVQNVGDWYFSSVYRSSLMGLITGYDDGRFGPTDQLTRAQAATILWRYLDPQEAGNYDASTAVNTSNLSDVADGQWYTGAVNWAVSAGIVHGYDNGTFGPDNGITREELCAIFANYAAGDLSSYDDSVLRTMPDGSSVSDWARKSIAWSLNVGLISGSEINGQRYVNPSTAVNRATMAAIVMNAVDQCILATNSNSSLTSGSVWVSTATGKVQVSATQGLITNTLLTDGDTCYFATSTGVVAKGLYVNPDNGYVYLADKTTGALPEAGWYLTDAFSDRVERYWVDDKTHACIPGYSPEGWAHYTIADGSVLRSDSLEVEGGVIVANNDGLLVANSLDAGWYVGSGIDGSFERYYLDDYNGMKVIRTGFFSASLSGIDGQFYALPDGAVLRGSLSTDNGALLADNDGFLAETWWMEGWLCTDDYSYTWQRYYFEECSGHLYAKTGFFTEELDGVECNFYAYLDGVVARGKTKTNEGVLVSDDDGVLAETFFGTGWCVTNEYDSDIERYYLVEKDGHLYALTGYFEANLDVGDGYGECTHEFMGDDTEGYIIRNATDLYYDGFVYSADSNGVLTVTGIGGSSSGTRDERVDTVTWATDTEYLARMKLYASIYDSDTDYFLAADWTLCRLTVLQRSGSSWVVLKCWNGNFGWNGVGVGGTHTIKHKQICNWDDSYFGQGYNDWSSCYIESYADYNVGGHSRYIEGRGWEDCAAIHSTGFENTGWDNTGCIGLLYDNAKWVYDVIPVGTNLYLF